MTARLIESVHLLPSKRSSANPNSKGKKVLRTNALLMPEEMNEVSHKGLDRISLNHVKFVSDHNRN